MLFGVGSASSGHRRHGFHSFESKEGLGQCEFHGSVACKARPVGGLTGACLFLKYGPFLLLAFMGSLQPELHLSLLFNSDCFTQAAVALSSTVAHCPSLCLGPAL